MAEWTGWAAVMIEALATAGGAWLVFRARDDRALEPRCAAAAFGATAPLLAAVRWVEIDVATRPDGWLLIGGGVTAGAAGLGLAWLFGRRGGPEHDHRLPATQALATAVILLLLGLAHRLSPLVALCAFAIGAVLLYLDTPHEHPASDDPAAGQTPSAIALGSVGVAIGLVLGPADGIGRDAALAIAWLWPVLVVAGIGRRLGSASARAALWVGIFGVWFGIAALGVRHAAHRALLTFRGDFAALDPVVASGFGQFALEAVVLLGLAAGAGLLTFDHRRVRLAGAGLATAAAVIAGLRLAGVGLTG